MTPNKPTNFGAAQISGAALKHQVRKGIPYFLGVNAKKQGLLPVSFFANSLAGDWSDSVDLNYLSVPLTMVWFLGTIDREGMVTPGGGIIPGSAFETGPVLEGAEVFSSAKANYACTKDTLTIKITSLNVGWPNELTAYFYYMTFYDDLGVQNLGL